MTQNFVLEVENAIKIFQHRNDNTKLSALNGCDLFVERGEIVSIIGPSGAGKTTLLRIISGTEELSSGKVIINSFEIQDWEERKRREFRKKFIGIFSQHSRDNLNPKHRVEEAIKWELLHANWPDDLINERITELLRKLNLKKLQKIKCGNLSAGEAMRVSLAKSIAKKPFIILADEPTGQLDTENMQLLYELMREIANEGTSIVVATHDIRFQSLSDKTYLIMDGKLASEEEGVELLFKHTAKQKVLDSIIKRTIFIDSTQSIRIPQTIIDALKLKRKAILEHNPKNGVTTLDKHPDDVDIVIKDEYKTREISIDNDFNVFETQNDIIQINNLHKTYSTLFTENKVLKNLNLNFKIGEFIVLLGPSGVGKTTLLSLLSGLDTATSGDIIINNKNMSKFFSQKAKVRQNDISYLSQNYILHPYLTVGENIELPNSLISKNKKLSKKVMKKYLEYLEVADYEDVLPTELSGGQRQRVALLTSILKDTPIILADEPTANLDSVLARRVMGLLEQLVKINKTLIVATHDLTLIKPGFRVIRLQNGEVFEDVIADKKYCDSLEKEFLMN